MAHVPPPHTGTAGHTRCTLRTTSHTPPVPSPPHPPPPPPPIHASPSAQHTRPARRQQPHLSFLQRSPHPHMDPIPRNTPSNRSPILQHAAPFPQFGHPPTLLSRGQIHPPSPSLPHRKGSKPQDGHHHAHKGPINPSDTPATAIYPTRQRTRVASRIPHNRTQTTCRHSSPHLQSNVPSPLSPVPPLHAHHRPYHHPAYPPNDRALLPF